jgi:hypothetical protein
VGRVATGGGACDPYGSHPGTSWLAFASEKISNLFVCRRRLSDVACGRWLHRLTAVRPRDIVSRANSHTVEQARRFVWAQDSSQTSVIEKHMSKKLEPLPLFPNLGSHASVTA